MTSLLLIEDDLTFATLLTRVLEIHGFSVIHAPTGLSGLKTARRINTDLILVDIHLPDIDGKLVALALKLRRSPCTRKSQPVIAITGDTGLNVIRLALAFGFDDCVSKPMDLQTFPHYLMEVMSSTATQ